MIFKPATQKDLEALAKHLASVLRGKAPYLNIYGSSLGGLARSSIMITLSLDPKSKWKNGILHNSRYSMFRLDADGTLEQFSKRFDLPRMRKAKVTGIPMAVKKIQDYLAKAKKETK